MVSPEAMQALQALDQGAVFNSIHTTARELIDAGLAFDGWGRLEISEAGRRAIRRDGPQAQPFRLDDHPYMAELRGPPLPADLGLPPTEPEANIVRPCSPVPPIEEPAVEIPWSRWRAMRAAGAANGRSGVWVEEAWIAAFIEAYEEIIP